MRSRWIYDIFLTETERANASLVTAFDAFRDHGFRLKRWSADGISILSANGSQELYLGNEEEVIAYLLDQRGGVVLWSTELDRDIWLNITDGTDPYDRMDPQWTRLSFSMSGGTFPHDDRRVQLSAAARDVFIRVSSTSGADGGKLTSEYLTEDLLLDGLASRAAALGVPLLSWLTYVPAAAFDERLREYIHRAGGRESSQGQGSIIEFGLEPWDMSITAIVEINRQWLAESAHDR